MQVKPFSPAEAKANKSVVVPKELLLAVNQLLSERYKDHGRITFTIKEVLQKARSFMPRDHEGCILDESATQDWVNQGFLDFEPIYREQGWEVSYDRPGYDETYEGFYIFQLPR